MRVRRYLLWLALFLAVTVAAAYLLRLPIAGHVVRGALADAGLKDVQSRVSALSFGRARIENLSAGPEGDETLRFDFIEADFDWRRVLRHREFDAVRLGPGAVHLTLSPDGKLSLPGLTTTSGKSGKLLFDTLNSSDIALRIDTPEGVATGNIKGDYDVETGSRAVLSLATSKAGFGSLHMENASAAAEIFYDPDGGAQFVASVTGDLVANALTARDAKISINAKDLSWRETVVGTPRVIAGEAKINIDIADIPVEHAPLLAAFNTSRAAAILGEPIKSLSFTGMLIATAAEGDITISGSPADAPPIVESDTGVALILTGDGDAPLYKRESGADHFAFSYSLAGAKVDVQGAVDAEKIGENWHAAAPIRFGPYLSDQFAFDEAAVTIDAIANSTEIEAEISVNSNLLKAKIGRLNIYDAPIDTTFVVVIDNKAGQAVVTQSSNCLVLESVRATIDRQDTEIILSGAEFCANGKPVAVIDWSGMLKSTFAGRLAASHARYRLGNTHLVGRPPQIEATAVYTPALNQTSINGDIDGGHMALNDLLNLTSTSGKATVSLDKEIMRTDLQIDQTRVSQQRDPPLVAPVLASVDFSLLGKKATFDYVLTTLSGARIGAGAGVHNVATSGGQSRLILDEITFAPDGMQPAGLLPVMKGIAREATGTATGFADFSWTRGGGIVSSADIRLKDMTFTGPTRIVNQTKGLNGNIQFADLWPLKTAGAQSITVESADLDALQLQSGEITFELRGDEMLRVEHAAFPWFGGALGVDNAVIALSGGEAVAPLRADKIDLGQILDFADFDGLSGEGILSGVLPLVVKDGRAHIENGVLKSDMPGAIRYRGKAGEGAAAAGEQAKVAFDLLRDLRYDSLEASVDGPLDGRLKFQINVKGTGDIAYNNENVRVPVNYNISLDAALLELLSQAQLTRKIELQLERGADTRD